MVIIVIKPWQARLIMALAFALFLAGGYRFSEHAATIPASAPMPLDAPLFEVFGADGLVSITVNVDWGAEEIPPMLDIFDRYGARVTFFLTGSWAQKNPDLTRLLIERGHEVANHGRRHDHPRKLSEQALVDHIDGNGLFLGSIIGESTKLYAPPYGEWDRRVVRTAARLGYRTVLWTVDTIDWQDPPPDLILQRVLHKARSGSIVLIHPKPNTVVALPGVLEGLKAKGLRPVKLSTMLEAAARPAESPGE